MLIFISVMYFMAAAPRNACRLSADVVHYGIMPHGGLSWLR